jgi:hypothetical protein
LIAASPPTTEQLAADQRWRAWQADGVARDRRRATLVSWLLAAVVAVLIGRTLIEVW